MALCGLGRWDMEKYNGGCFWLVLFDNVLWAEKKRKKNKRQVLEEKDGTGILSGR